MKYTRIYYCTHIEGIEIRVKSRESHGIAWHSMSWRLCFLLTPKLFDLPKESEQGWKFQWENETTADVAPQTADVARFPAEVRDHWVSRSASVSSASSILSFRDAIRYWAQSLSLLKAHIPKALSLDAQAYCFTSVLLKINQLLCKQCFYFIEFFSSSLKNNGCSFLILD